MYTACGTAGRIVSYKLSPGDDLMEKYVEICNMYDLKNGVILSGFGSLQNAVVKNVIAIPGVKYGAGYGGDTELDGPIELIGVSGIICHTDEGDVQPHIHIILSDKEGNGYGGHLCEGTKVQITVEGAIAEIDGVNMRKLMDHERNILVFRPEQL